MKLYAFRPTGFGEVSFFVMAESEEDARKFVETKIESAKNKQDNESWLIARSKQGWNQPGYYDLEVYESGEVAINDNS